MASRSKPLTVLHLAPVMDWVGGVETYLLTLIPLLEGQGIAQAICFGDGRGDLVCNSFHIPELNKLGSKHGKIARSTLRKIINVVDPDIIHIHHIANVQAIAYCMTVRPVVITTHGYQFICPASDFFYDWTNKICSKARYDITCFVMAWLKGCLSRNPRHAFPLYRRAQFVSRNARRIAAIISPSKYTAERYMRAGFPSDRVNILPYFCPIQPRLDPRPEPKDSCIVFMGRLAHYKGFNIFIEALGLLPEVKGLIVGNLTDTLIKRVRELSVIFNCEERLELKEWVPRNQVHDIMSQASVLVFPSLWPETLGIVGLEALACGVPVVAADIGGVREWLIHEQTGLLVPPGDARATAAAINVLLENPDLRRRMGENGISLMRTKFSPETHVAKLIDIYTDAVKFSS